MHTFWRNHQIATLKPLPMLYMQCQRKGRPTNKFCIISKLARNLQTFSEVHPCYPRCWTVFVWGPHVPAQEQLHKMTVHGFWIWKKTSKCGLRPCLLRCALSPVINCGAQCLLLSYMPVYVVTLVPFRTWGLNLGGLSIVLTCYACHCIALCKAPIYVAYNWLQR